MDSSVRDYLLKAKSDYYFFAKNILKYKDLIPDPHEDLCKFLEAGKEKKLILMPRGSFKSSIVTVGHALFSLVKRPNERILIASAIHKNARKYAKEIKNHIEGNELFRQVFGDWRPWKQTWKDDEFLIGKRTKVLKEPSILASSLERNIITGMHFSSIYLDDAVEISTVSTPNQITKTLDYYRYLQSVLDPGGRLYVVGTPYSVFDLYHHIAEEEKELFDIFKRSAHKEDGSLLLPHVLSESYLEAQKKTQGIYIYNAQYELNCVPEGAQTFPDKGIQFFKEAPQYLNYFMSVDPAIAVHTKSDFSGIVVIGVDWKDDWFVVEAEQVKLPLDQLVGRIFEHATKYQPLMILAMEKFIIERVMKTVLLKAMEERGFFIPLKDIPTDNRVSKEARIRSLQPRFMRKAIFLKENQLELRMQLHGFPLLKNDDILDALKNLTAVTFPCDKKPKEDDPLAYLSTNERHIWEKDLREIDKVHNNVRRSVRRMSIW